MCNLGGGRKAVGYSVEIERDMMNLYNSLSECDRRRYAAIEAKKTSVEYIARVLACDPKTIRRGCCELGEPLKAGSRIRRPGGGRKKRIKSQKGSELNTVFLDVVSGNTAGDPMREEKRWTNLSRQLIADRLASQGHSVSRNIVFQLLKEHKFSKRKAQKSMTMGEHRDRNAQFERIAELKKTYTASCNPILSIDTKKKELIGNFYRDGKLYTQEVIKTNDHDFKSSASGVIIPHGLYDLKRNEGYLYLGTSHDTGEFACDNVERWWLQYGRIQYALATSLLLLCDGGGSNSANHYIFKEDIEKLAVKIGIEIRVAHYPPYTSKYNPIEHRLFPHVTRACQGVVFDSIDTVKSLMTETKTKTGLKVAVEIVDKAYQTGRKYAENFKDNMSIIFDKIMPKWNYSAPPLKT